MEWSERMNAAVDYIEENLAGEIDFNKAAEKAACSIFHFQRIFFAINSLTPVEYARRRKLTLAAMELAADNAKVIDVAMKYGYDSPNAFTRAFRQVHGITPQAARAPGVTLTAYPRISFNIVLKGGNDMDYRILEKPAFDVIGKARKFTTGNKENLKKIPQFWEEFVHDENGEKVLLELTQCQLGEVTGALELGVCSFTEKTIQEFSYAIGVEKPEKAVPAGFEVIHIPAATWAVFEYTGPQPDTIQTVTKRIFEEWFPSTGYEHAPVPELEVYLPDNPSGNCRGQVWMPIIKKNKK